MQQVSLLSHNTFVYIVTASSMTPLRFFTNYWTKRVHFVCTLKPSVVVLGLGPWP